MGVLSGVPGLGEEMRPGPGPGPGRQRGAASTSRSYRRKGQHGGAEIVHARPLTPVLDAAFTKPEGLLAHYTKAAFVFGDILPSGTLLLSPYRLMWQLRVRFGGNTSTVT